MITLKQQSNQFLAWLNDQIRDLEWHKKSLENMLDDTSNKIDMLKTMRIAQKQINEQIKDE